MREEVKRNMCQMEEKLQENGHQIEEKLKKTAFKVEEMKEEVTKVLKVIIPQLQHGIETLKRSQEKRDERVELLEKEHESAREIMERTRLELECKIE